MTQFTHFTHFYVEQVGVDVHVLQTIRVAFSDLFKLVCCVIDFFEFLK